MFPYTDVCISKYISLYYFYANSKHNNLEVIDLFLKITVHEIHQFSQTSKGFMISQNVGKDGKETIIFL